MRDRLVVLLAVLCFSLFALSQTAEELVNKNIAAKGGMDKIQTIKSLRIRGKAVFPGGFAICCRGYLSGTVLLPAFCRVFEEWGEFMPVAISIRTPHNVMMRRCEVYCVKLFSASHPFPSRGYTRQIQSRLSSPKDPKARPVYLYTNLFIIE